MPSRQTPIPETIEKVPGYPDTLRIFKIAASKFYWTRASFSSRFITRSTKTELRSEAMKAAKAFYHELLLKNATTAPVASPKEFESVIEDLIREDEGRVARGERKQSMVADLRHIGYQDLLPFFKNDKLKNLDFARVSAYVTDAQAKRKEPLSTSTLKNHFIILRKILKHAHKLGKVDKLPIFPTLSSKNHPREWFSTEQYRLLRKTINDCVGVTVPKTYTPITDELRHLSTFLVNTFLRPQDIKNLRQRHITIVEERGRSYLRITTPDSKTIKSPVVSMPVAVDIYKSLLKLNGTDPDAFVFFPKLLKRSYAFQTIRLQFNYVLEKAGLKFAEDGTPRTLYSLRHTAIMFRLTKGDNVDLLTLARNCRTSVDMIEKFYASHLKPEMNVDALTRMRKQPTEDSR